MRGRKPKAPELRIIQGETRKRGLAVASPIEPAPGVLKVPGYFDEAHVEKWHEVTAVMRGQGTLGLDVADTVRWYVEAVLEAQAARAHVREFGAIVAAPRTGVPMHSPYRTIAMQAEASALKLAIELGFTPSSRGRIAKPASVATTNRFLIHGLAVVK